MFNDILQLVYGVKTDFFIESFPFKLRLSVLGCYMIILAPYSDPDSG